eukprot:TRINITY_DN10958_c0_g1_i1.p3 TRINITY_DN10958_c0_g1~~TRINITY_DN10958_c0_g1_i1.p3  ORF type:complete len:57 (-),score=5.28 TRINITY_DN10958_c0_g1_i1:80-250(-)
MILRYIFLIGKDYRSRLINFQEKYFTRLMTPQVEFDQEKLNHNNKKIEPLDGKIQY